jgi:hypothetical protein
MECLEFFGLKEGYIERKEGTHWGTWPKRVMDARKLERKRMRP